MNVSCSKKYNKKSTHIPIHYLPSDFDTCHHQINFENKIMT